MLPAIIRALLSESLGKDVEMNGEWRRPEATTPHARLAAVERFVGNPILAPRPDLWWASRKVYNAAATEQDGVTMLIFRAVGQDWKSRLGLATSIGGTRFDIVPTFLLGPSGPLDCEGVEDPRLTKVDDQLVLTYTAFDGRCARQSPP